MARTAKRLRDEHVRTAVIDLTTILGTGSEPTADNWYYGLVYRIQRELGHSTQVDTWWQDHSGLPPVQRFIEYLKEIILGQGNERTVIFVDEIDRTIDLPFSDGFFAAIRACYNARATEVDFGRLSWVLIGVATPDQLISDELQTPFNIGKRVDLGDFSGKEAEQLLVGLEDDAVLLERVLYWTDGHPYLTQFICHQITKQRGVQVSTELIDQMVEKHFISNQTSSPESNIFNIQKRLTAGRRAHPRLRLYKKIILGERTSDEPSSLLHAELKLSGVVKVSQNGALRVRNRLYEQVFSLNWVNQRLPANRVSQWAATAILLLVLVTVWYAKLWPKPYIDQLRSDLGKDDYSSVSEIYQTLQHHPLARRTVKETLALYWDQRAKQAMVQGRRDEGLLSILQSLLWSDSQEQRQEAQYLIGEDWNHLRRTVRHSRPVYSVAFSSDGHRIVTASDDGTARLWDTYSGAALGQPLRHADRVRAVAFGPEDKRVITASDDGTARLWSVESGQALGQPLRHVARIRAVAFSPRGDRVLTGSDDGTARLWSALSGEALSKPLSHKGRVRAVAFSPDGGRIVTGGGDGTARLWDSQSGEALGEILQHESQILAVTFSPDGRRVATASTDGTAQLWDAWSGKSLGDPLRHRDWVFAVTFSPDGGWLATASDDGSARIWNVESGESQGQPLRHDSRVRAITFSPDGDRVVTASLDGTARLWKAKTGEPMGEPLIHDSWVLSVAFSPNGNRVVTSSKAGTVRLWEPKNSEKARRPLRHNSRVRAVSLSPDGHRIMTGSEDGTVQFWATRNGEPLSEPIDRGAAVLATAFSPKNNQVAAGTHDGTLWLWGFQSSGTPDLVIRHESQILAVAFSPDGERVATASSSGMTRLWNARSGEALSGALRHDSRVLAVAFSPDSNQVVTACEDGTAWLWSARNGEPLGQPLRHGSWIRAVAFSPDSDLVATASNDGTARLWNNQSGEPQGQPIQHHSWVFAVAFNPNGDRLMTASSTIDTIRWLHLYTFANNGQTQIIASRLLRGSWTGAYRFPDSCNDCLEIAMRDTGDSIRLETVHFDVHDVPPVSGDPRVLFSEWQQRLALRFTEAEGDFYPFFSASSNGSRK